MRVVGCWTVVVRTLGINKKTLTGVRASNLRSEISLSDARRQVYITLARRLLGDDSVPALTSALNRTDTILVGGNPCDLLASHQGFGGDTGDGEVEEPVEPVARANLVAYTKVTGFDCLGCFVGVHCFAFLWLVGDDSSV